MVGLLEAEDMCNEEKDSKTPSTRRRRLWRIIQLLHFVVLPLLLFVYLLFAVERQEGPVYRAVAGTPIERFCLRVIPILWRHKSFLERQAMDASLSPAERAEAKVIMQRMELIRPTHSLRLNTGEMLFGRLRNQGNGTLMLKMFDGTRLVRRELKEEEIEHRKTIVSPSVSMETRDLRFLLSHPDMNHYYLHPYIFATDRRFSDVFELYIILSTLADEFRKEFGPLIGEQQVEKIHVCQFDNRVRLADAAGKLGGFGLVNASGFFMKTDHRLFLVADSMATDHIFGMSPGGDDALFNPQTPAENTLLRHQVTRHEGAHQLAYALGVFESFERIPFWLEEGIAQYCEQTPFRSLHEGKMMFLSAKLKAGQLIPWDQLVALTPKKLEELSEEQVQLAYAQSWILFYHLMDKAYRPKLFAAILDLSKISDPAAESNSTVLLGNALGTTLSQLNQEIRQRILDYDNQAQ